MQSSGDENLAKIYSDASAQWLDGRPEDAAGALKYVIYRSSDQALNSAALRDLAVLLSEAGKNEEALAYLMKGEILSPEDFYIHFEKGWNLLSLEKYQDARAAFEKALTLTGDQDLASQSRFAMGIAEAELGGPNAAVEELRSVYTRYPYLLSPLAQLISMNLERLKRRPHAVNFMGEALTYDPRNIQAELDLARLYEEANFYVPAWQTYYTLTDLDPGEKFFLEKEKTAQVREGKADNMLYWARMAWPSHKTAAGRQAEGQGGAYAGKDGVPSLVKSFSFIAATDFDLVDTRLGNISSGRSNMQWTVSYDEMNRIYKIRDSMGATAHTTTNSLRIVPKIPGGVILIKSPDLAGVYGVNRGDKEVSGELLALVREKGFWLINETTPENLVSPITAQLADGSRLPEHLKALAVTVRTRLALLSSLPSHESREYSLCDSSHCLPFAGLQAESAPQRRPPLETQGETLLVGAAWRRRIPPRLRRFTRGGINDGGSLSRMTP